MRTTVIAVSVIIAVSGLVLAEKEGTDLQVWKGKHRDELVEGWGEPQDLKKKRGGEVFVYEVWALSQIDEIWTPCSATADLRLHEEVQKVRFWVGSDGRITKVKPEVFKLKPDPGPPDDGQGPKPPELWLDLPSGNGG